MVSVARKDAMIAAGGSFPHGFFDQLRPVQGPFFTGNSPWTPRNAGSAAPR
jgi:hypothetical protein